MKLSMCPYFETYVHEKICKKCQDNPDRSSSFRRLMLKTYGLEDKLSVHFICPGPEEVTQSAQNVLPFAKGQTVIIDSKKATRKRYNIKNSKSKKQSSKTDSKSAQFYETCKLVISKQICCGGRILLNCAKGRDIQPSECDNCEYREE